MTLVSVSIPALHLTSDGALRRRLNRLSEPVRQGLPPRRSLECAAICKQVQTCRLGVQSACTSSNSQCTRPQITATLEIILHSTPRQEMPDVQMAVDKNISGPSPTLAGMRRSVGYESKRDVSREPTLMPTTREPSTKSVPVSRIWCRVGKNAASISDVHLTRHGLAGILHVHVPRGAQAQL